MEKRFFKIAPYIVIVGIFYMVSVFSIIAGAANIGIPCFSVDSSERLYIGLSGKILVYDEGTQIASISPKTSRTYMFEVQSDDTIILSTSTTVYLLDLDGNVIDSWDDTGCNTYRDLQRGKRHQSSENGTQYSIKSPLGWTRIVRDGNELVYRISIYSYVMKLLLFISVPALVACAIYCVGKKE